MRCWTLAAPSRVRGVASGHVARGCGPPSLLAMRRRLGAALGGNQPPAHTKTNHPLCCRPVAALDAHGCMPLHYVALRGDLALFVLLFSPSAPALADAHGAGAALLTAAIRGGSSEMAGIVLLTGATTPQVGAGCAWAGRAQRAQGW